MTYTATVQQYDVLNLRRRLDDYERNVPPHVRAARLADDYNDRLGRPRQYQRGGWISYVISVNGPKPSIT